jgi:hypothetical protein
MVETTMLDFMGMRKAKHHNVLPCYATLAFV